jgi:hypothetical protein
MTVVHPLLCYVWTQTALRYAKRDQIVAGAVLFDIAQNLRWGWGEQIEFSQRAITCGSQRNMELSDVMKRKRTQSRWNSMGLTLMSSAKFIGDITVTHYYRSRSYLVCRKCWLNWYGVWLALLDITVSIPDQETHCPDLWRVALFSSVCLEIRSATGFIMF